MRVKVSSILKCFLVILFLSYYGGTTLFTHTHTVDGVKITHSHPYLPSGHHSHSSTAFQQIEQLSNFVFIIGAVFSLFALTGFRILFHIPAIPHIRPVNSFYYQLRAPPYMLNR